MWSVAMSWSEHTAHLRHNAREVGKVLGGIVDYYRKGSVTKEARSALLQLHCDTNGRFTNQLATLIRSLRRPRRPSPVTGFLGELTVEQQTAIASSIARDGYYVFEQRIPSEFCDQIEAFAARTPCRVEDRGAELQDRLLFDSKEPISKTYRVMEDDITANGAMQRLMADPSMLAIAEIYLKSHPILSMMNLWWSAKFGDKPGDNAAQEFHFDFDPPPAWLLFFIYVTDVGSENGPHVYARGSHVAGHPAAGPLLSRGYVRIPDSEVAAAFGEENVVELLGKRGTILAVDTRGFHKGKMLNAGHRLMVQLTYSYPPYSGAHGAARKIGGELDPSLAKAIKTTPRVFERYT
jgi:hypothetical protein